MHEHTAQIFIIMNKVGMLTTKVLFLKAVGERKERQEMRKQAVPKLTSPRNKTPHLSGQSTPEEQCVKRFHPTVTLSHLCCSVFIQRPRETQANRKKTGHACSAEHLGFPMLV